MAEARIPLEDFNKSHDYDDISILKELETFLMIYHMIQLNLTISY